MTQINMLSAVDTLSGGDQIPIWATSNGDTRRTSMATLADYLTPLIGSPVEVKQYATPTNGQTVTVGQGDPTWLIVTPAGTLATMTINLGATPVDMQEVVVSCSQIITALTVTSTGSTVGQPTALAANGFFRMKYDAVMTTWRRVG